MAASAPRRVGAAASDRPRFARIVLFAVGVATVAAAVPATASATSATSATSGAPVRDCANGSYTIGRGDGWSIIARKVGVTTKALLAANRATTSTVIHPGRSLCLPAGATSAAPATPTSSSKPSNASGSGSSGASAACAKGTYTVVKGDGWMRIAAKVGSTTKDLLAANNATVSTVLFAGRSVCLPSGATAPSSAAATPATVTVRAYTAAENEAIIRAVWPDELEEEAMRIARRESNLQNRAKNSCCYGLFQIHWTAHTSWLSGMGVTNAGQLLDPNVNVAAAYQLYQRAGGFGPWAL